jgi:hypothetical protein
VLQGVSGDFDPSGKKHCCADVVATSWSRSKRKDACTARRRPVVRNGMPLRGDGVCGVRMVGCSEVTVVVHLRSDCQTARRDANSGRDGDGDCWRQW